MLLIKKNNVTHKHIYPSLYRIGNNIKITLRTKILVLGREWNFIGGKKIFCWRAHRGENDESKRKIKERIYC